MWWSAVPLFTQTPVVWHITRVVCFVIFVAYLDASPRNSPGHTAHTHKKQSTGVTNFDNRRSHAAATNAATYTHKKRRHHPLTCARCVALRSVRDALSLLSPPGKVVCAHHCGKCIVCSSHEKRAPSLRGMGGCVLTLKPPHMCRIICCWCSCGCNHKGLWLKECAKFEVFLLRRRTIAIWSGSTITDAA